MAVLFSSLVLPLSAIVLDGDEIYSCLSSCVLAMDGDEALTGQVEEQGCDMLKVTANTIP